MTVAPTSEIASGREDEHLGQRLAPDAVEQGGDEEAQAHAAGRRHDQPDDVVPKDLEERPRAEARPVVEREHALLVEEAADHRGHGRIDEVDRQQDQGRCDEDPRNDPITELGREALDDRARARKQEPDPANPDEQRDGGEQELGEELIALPVSQRLGTDGVAEQVVDRGKDVLTAVRVDQDPDPEGRGDQPDQAEDQHRSRRAVRARSQRAFHRPVAPPRKIAGL